MHTEDPHAELVFALDEVLRTDHTGDGVHWTLAAGEDLNVNLVTLAPTSTIARHVNDEVDVLLVVLEGSGTLLLDGNDHELAARVVALAPKHAARTITAGAAGIAYLTVHRRKGLLGITSRSAR